MHHTDVQGRFARSLSLLLAALLAAGTAAAQHPHGSLGGPNFPAEQMQPPLPPAQNLLHGGRDNVPRISGVAPPPPGLIDAVPQLPENRTTTPPPHLLRRIVADRIRLLDQPKKETTLDTVEVEIVPGGYLVTKEYTDHTPRVPWHWSHQEFVPADHVRVLQPHGTVYDPMRPPLPTFADDGKPLIFIDPGDPFGLNDPHLRRLREEKQWQESINEILRGQMIRDKEREAQRLLSDRNLLEMEIILTSAVEAGLLTGLEAAKLVPVLGTVVEGGTAAYEQYGKTYGLLIQAGVDPQVAQSRALLQALTVGGVAAGADLATGAILNKLKTVGRVKAFYDGIGKNAQKLAEEGRIAVQNTGRVKTVLETAADQMVIATGKGATQTVPAIAQTLAGGTSTPPGARPPAAVQHFGANPYSRGNPYGLHFYLP